jgi:hypothetical protein
MKDQNNERLQEHSHALHLTINDKTFDWSHQYITGAEIRKLGGIPKDDHIFLAIKKPWEDELIVDDTRVDLARPAIEHFYSKEHCEFPITLIVNGRERSWDKDHISYEEVVELAFERYEDNGTTSYTVTYKGAARPKTEGTMVKGDIIHVKNKTKFNVTATSKS